MILSILVSVYSLFQTFSHILLHSVTFALRPRPDRRFPDVLSWSHMLPRSRMHGCGSEWSCHKRSGVGRKPRAAGKILMQCWPKFPSSQNACPARRRQQASAARKVPEITILAKIVPCSCDLHSCAWSVGFEQI